MLFTDSDILTIDHLIQVDSEAADAAKRAKPAIVVDGDNSICAQAWSECGRKLLQAMQSYVSYPAQTGMPASHIAAVTNVGVPARAQSRVRLNQIVATETQYAGMQSQIELWMTCHALYLLYRGVSARSDQDRFEEKMNRYEQRAIALWQGVRTEGLPMVYQPLEAPGAKHSYNAGTWDDTAVSAVSGSGTAGGSFRVAITYCDATRGYVSQSNRGNAESAPSDIESVTTNANEVVRVDITKLNPPTGAMDPVGLAQGAWTPLKATHWNLWVGGASGPLYLQRELIPIATKQATLAADPVLSGSTVGSGQYADLNLVFMNVVMRG